MKAYFLKSIFITTVSAICLNAHAKVNADCGTVEQCYEKILEAYLRLSAQVAEIAPAKSIVGEVIAYAGNESSIPVGWLLCDGREIPQNQYPDLFAVIKTIYGTATDAKNNFKIPDYRGVFLRGVDAGRNMDPERAGLGTFENDMFKSHSHGFKAEINLQSQKTAWVKGEEEWIAFPFNDLQTDATGGAETRPKNISVNYIIYAGHTGDFTNN